MATLRQHTLFEGLSPADFGAISRQLEWLALPAGATLFEAGDAADGLYVVLSGCLSAIQSASCKGHRVLGRVAAGESVGEMALLSGSPRSATVVALRDSELVHLSNRAFEALVLDRPQTMLQLARLTAKRLEASQSGEIPDSSPKTFAVLPQSASLDARAFAQKLAGALERFGAVRTVRAAEGRKKTSAWFHELEAGTDFVVYVAEPEASPWSRLCLRQSDSLLLLARATEEPGSWECLASPEDSRTLFPRSELVLLHETQVAAGRAGPWLAEVPGGRHHHVRSSKDVERLARILTGNATGLVLSGGGARGFAHIGVIRALRERGVLVDLVGGTSMGAVVGAAVAAEWSDADMMERFHRAFVASKPLAEITLPIVSLVSGRSVTRLLKQAFGDLAIEDLPVPYFCTSSNLTRGASTTHRSGELWRWLRASVAIPGVLPPVFHHGEVFVDGGVMSNLPMEGLSGSAARRRLGVDVSPDLTMGVGAECADLPPLWQPLTWWRQVRQLPSIFRILVRAGTVNTATATAASGASSHATLMIRPELPDVDLLDWRAFGRAVDSGYRYALARLDAVPDLQANSCEEGPG